MRKRSFLVTGGTGFIGSALVKRLVAEGHDVRVLDNQSRGDSRRLAGVTDKIDFMEADIRDAEMVGKAVKGVDSVLHLAFVNGTEYFYSKPELVLDVGVKGMVNVLDACIENGVKELVLASSSEVYQTPPYVPTDERVPLSIPDPCNPRYSYGAGKMISEIMAINYGKKHFDRVLIFRPHNVYGPDMGWEHVIPQFAIRMKDLIETGEEKIKFPIQGTGKETRSFVFIEDFTDGLMCMLEKGDHLGIYNIGTEDEIPISRLAKLVAGCFGRDIDILPGDPARGGTARRCPDIKKLKELGYSPRFSLKDGLGVTVKWYSENARKKNTGA
ncbi:MAG: SDR family NAD(P)-dependent oxidoreductase [Candidatus Omnitrophica bacterium]|nr:SDR family NAD(P)-dependent oxidoreductase [Candidatus Omnitrophota bacterium]